MKYSLQTATTSALILLVTLSALNLYLYFSSSRSAEFHEKQVTHTYETILLSNLFLSQIKDAETGQRGFLLTQEEAYLEPYYDGIKLSAETLDQLRSLTFDTPPQQIRLSKLRTQMGKKFEELQLTIDHAKSGNMDLAIETVMTGYGKAVMDEIRATVEEFTTEEKQLLNKHVERYHSEKQASHIKITIALSLFFFATLITAFQFRARFINPIITLIESTKQFAQNKTKPIHVESFDNEIGLLAKSFSDMSKETVKTIAELEKKKEKSEETSSTKSRFLLNMSREIRYPLNGIYGILQLFQKGEYSTDKEFLMNLEKAIFSCRDMQTIIDDFIDYSKLESGRLKIIPGSFSILKTLHKRVCKNHFLAG